MSNSKQNDWVSLIINRFEEQVRLYYKFTEQLFWPLETV